MLATKTSFPKIGFDEIDMSYLLDTIPQQEETYDSDQTEEETYEEIIKVYPGIKEVHAQKDYTCAFSGGKISKGSLYVCYRPMIKNITRGETYVLQKTLRVELGYESDLPTDIDGIEDFSQKINNHANQIYDNIDYYNLFVQSGGGLNFVKLKNRRPYENRNSKRS